MSSVVEVLYGYNSQRILIGGPKDSGKTCTAWSLACDLALESELAKPLIICNKNRLETKFPYRMHIFDDIEKDIEEKCHDISILDRITLKYVSNIHELKLVVGCLFSMKLCNASTGYPTCLVIEDLNDIIDPCGAMNKNETEYQSMLLNIIQMLNNSLAYLEKKTGCLVKLIITDSCAVDYFIKMCFLSNLIDTHIKLVPPHDRGNCNAVHTLVANMEAYRMVNASPSVRHGGIETYPWCFSVFKLGSIYVNKPRTVYSTNYAHEQYDPDGYLCMVPTLR